MAVTGEDYGGLLSQLLPAGTAWTNDQNSNLQRLLRALGESLARAHARADDLDRETDPNQALEILGRWEQVMGLPDRCAGILESTLQGRRNAVMAKLFSATGQSRAYFIEMARALGYQVTISEHREFRAGLSCAGDPISNGDWVCVWRVNAPAVTIIPFRAGLSAAGEPLQAWDNAALECKINLLKPAHTLAHMGYGGIEADDHFMAADRLFAAANYRLPGDLENL